MRFAPGTTKAQMQAAMEAFENRSKAKNAAIAAQPPVMPSSLPTSRPNVDPAFLAKAVASGALPPPRPSTPGTMTSPSARPNVEMPQGPLGISVGVRGTPTYKEHFLTPRPGQINPSQPGMATRPGTTGMVTRPGQSGMGGLGQGVVSSVNTTSQSDIMGGNRRPMGGFNPGNMMQGLQSIAARNNPQVSSPAAPAFKKGGKVTAKAKAPVKKAAGGKVAAKPMARPVAKAKPMAKPMSAMKRGGKVMMKGKYK